MSWSKGTIVQQAFEALGLQGYVFDLQPEEVQTGLRMLDSMMATWDAQEIYLGYQLTSDPGAVDPDTDSGLPDSANEAVYCNLALRLAPGFGKQVSQLTSMVAKNGYDALLSKALVQATQQMQLPTNLPLGAGNRRYRKYVAPSEPTDIFTIDEI